MLVVCRYCFGSLGKVEVAVYEWPIIEGPSFMDGSCILAVWLSNCQDAAAIHEDVPLDVERLLCCKVVLQLCTCMHGDSFHATCKYLDLLDLGCQQPCTALVGHSWHAQQC
eukprot:GHUV01022447.1.p2 GENE.GHUV01022447.1~~GHUV01022447.1.p2  ORF type:complete len:111 (+),score=14.15 GHUV01022447.1:769-1101(+)